MLGVARRELLGRQLRAFLVREDLLKHKTDWSALRRGTAFIGERRLKRKDGSIFSVEVSAKRLSDGRFEGILRDITRRKEEEQTLRERERRFRNLTAAAFEGIGISEGGKVVEVNDQLARMLGYTREELLGRSVSVMVAPQSRRLVSKAIKTGHEDPYEHLALRKDGTVFEAEVRAKTVLWGGRRVRVTAIRDITERKRAAEALKRQLVFNQILNQVLSAFATCAMAEADAAVRRALQAIAQFIGADHAFVVVISDDKRTYSLTHEWCAAHVQPQSQRYQQMNLGTRPWSETRLLNGAVLRINTLADYPPGAEADSSDAAGEGALSILIAPIRGQAGEITGCVGLHAHARPITWSDPDAERLKMVGDAIANLLERKRAEESVREIAHRLHRAEDAERRRIARELHDSTAQDLAAVVMNLGLLEDLLPRPEHQAAKLLRESTNLVERCSQEVRTMSYLLHPPLLDQIGLEAALRSYVEGFSKRSAIKVSLQLPGDKHRLPEEIELTLFRVVQEALGNIHRHSGSRTARIRLVRRPGQVRLEISDRGVGMTALTLKAIQDGSMTSGFGLAGMQERLREVGGRLEIHSAAAGTRLQAQVPVHTG
jgi:PAS domain S-box-containing protein